MNLWGAWVAQSVKHPTSAQVMILHFVGSSPVLALCLEPVSASVSPSLSAPPLLTLSLSLSLSKINKQQQQKPQDLDLKSKMLEENFSEYL